MLPANDNLSEEFIRQSAGPGGQHVNKTSNGVRLTYDFANDASLPEDVKMRLQQLAGSALQAGKIVFEVSERRSLQQNRLIARERLDALLQKAFIRPVRRKKTHATHASVLRRLAQKARRSDIKAHRRPPRCGED